MDLQLFFRVIWRFRVLIAVGFAVALLLAFLSYVRVSPAGISYRQQEQWESLSEVFVTSQGFPWGSLSDAAGANAGEPTAGRSAPDAGRLSSLAGLYVQLATTDAVLKQMAKTGPVHGMIRAFPVFPNNNSDDPPLPLITLSATAKSSTAAKKLGIRYLASFKTFIAERQRKAGIAEDDRVRLEVVRQPAPGELLVGRKKTRPILIFVTVMMAMFGLAFILENARPRVRAIGSVGDQRADTTRRTA